MSRVTSMLEQLGFRFEEKVGEWILDCGRVHVDLSASNGGPRALMVRTAHGFLLAEPHTFDIVITEET